MPTVILSGLHRHGYRPRTVTRRPWVAVQTGRVAVPGRCRVTVLSWEKARIAGWAGKRAWAPGSG
ncbi:protein of unknown function [Streptomyces sp. KY75]|nr:protein of unknown function [Streptomyces sp. KY75]CAD5995319.1 protein of unknown function [Streptomyces sp. KY70]